ncbi:MAG: rRNA cytosine-C5-methyltransferase [Flavobacteriales bacterium]|nr:rRNA cytosine-C5-methyltransferase [Flavobacteriales bacterium]
MSKGRRHGPAASTAPLPAELLARLAMQTDASALREALEDTPSVSVRYNPFKPTEWAGEPVPWCALGRYLADRPRFTLDPQLHAGAYYVQEASSMLIEQAYLQGRPAAGPLRVLDLCAAPGGKSGHLASLLPEGSLLVANELDRTRLAVLQENLWKQGRPGVVITHDRTEAFAALPGAFELVLVDAPCSGEGMMRRDPFARAQWSPALVQQCALVQRKILDHAWTALAPGGTLIYSTCTWAPEEDEQQVEELITLTGALPIALELNAEWGMERGPLGVRCYPHRVRGEGFFLSVLRKPGAFHDLVLDAHHAGANSFPELQWLIDPGRWSCTMQEDIAHVVEAAHHAFVQRLMAAVRTAAPGTPALFQKGGEARPHPALALSTALHHEFWPTIDLEHEQALAYLRGESLSTSAARGTALMRYHGLALGWSQGAGKRWNNQWPKPWRIRMQA